MEAELLVFNLRSLRKQVADEQSVAPYTIFADSTLRLMAQQRPQTLAEFSRLSGVGDYKLQQYGQRFVDAIRETGASCAHTAVIFYYGIFPQTEKTLGDHGVSLHYLCTWWDVLAEAKAQNAFSAETLAEVEKFLNAPKAWQDAHKN